MVVVVSYTVTSDALRSERVLHQLGRQRRVWLATCENDGDKMRGQCGGGSLVWHERALGSRVRLGRAHPGWRHLSREGTRGRPRDSGLSLAGSRSILWELARVIEVIVRGMWRCGGWRLGDGDP